MKKACQRQNRPLAEGGCGVTLTAADGKRHRRSVRWGETQPRPNRSGLLSQLEIDDNGIELSAVQEPNRRWHFLTDIGREIENSSGRG
jgi:hypothetical protein